MKKQVKISVIIPVYNAEKYLNKCLESVLNQTFSNIEIICVNDGSKDKSLDTLNLFAKKDSRIKILDKENGGAATARNIGIKAAVGKYLLFVDSDDFVEPDLCEIVYNRAEKTKADIVLFDADFFNPETGKFGTVSWLLNKNYLPNLETFNCSDISKEFFMSVSGGPCNKLFRRDFIIDNGIDFPIMASLEDVPFVYTAMALAKRISYVDKVLEHYRRHINGSNLVSKIDLYPERIFDSFRILKERLVNANVFDKVKLAFLNRAAVDFVDQFLYTIKNPHVANYFRFYLTRIGSYEFGFRDMSKEEFVKAHTYNKLQELFAADEYYKQLQTEFIPTISVIVPVYNSENYLWECINSILRQSFRKFELILVDDGSTDNSLKILRMYEKLDCRIKVLTQQNKFAGAARNLGISVARGKYLQFLDSDDFFESNMLEELYKTAEKYSAEIVLCDGNYFDNVTKISTPARFLLQRYNIPDNMPFSYADKPDKILHVTIDCPWNKLFLKSFIDKHSLQFQALRSANDVYFVDSALILANKIAVIDKQLLNYRTNVKTSLQANRAKEPLNFYQALTAVKNRVKNEERFASIKRSLLSLFISACRHHLNKARDEEEYNLLYSFYKNTAFNEWELDPTDKSAYVYAEDRLWVETVINSTEKEYLFSEGKKGVVDFIKKKKNTASERLKNLPSRLVEHLGGIPKVIVSMTSFPARINTIHLVVKNMLEQTVKPDMIMLYLAKSQFPALERELPTELLDCKNLGLQIKWCDEDIRPHKKYYYVMQEFPNDLVITVDDDLIYRNDMIEILLNSYIRYPYAVSAMRTHLITQTSDGEIAPYKEWKKEYSGILNIPSMQLFSTSGAGTLYPPKCMGTEVFDIDSIKGTCINADDIWLKIMQIIHNVPVVLAFPNEELKYLENTQEDRLYNVNVLEGKNDSQFSDTAKEYSKKMENDTIAARVFSTPLVENNTKKPVSAIPPKTPISTTAHSPVSTNQNSNTVHLNEKINALNLEIKNICNSWSYKIGRFITFIPRKIVGGFKCIKENGFKYTCGRFLVHLHLKKDPYK